jgi:hypothetical protein
MQSKQIKTPHTHTLNGKGVVWLWHRRAGQAVEALGRLNSGRKESRPCACVSYVIYKLVCMSDGDRDCW